MSSNSTADAFTGHRFRGDLRQHPARRHPAWSVMRGSRDLTDLGSRGLEVSRRIPIEATSRRGGRLLTTPPPDPDGDERTHISVRRCASRGWSVPWSVVVSLHSGNRAVPGSV